MLSKKQRIPRSLFPSLLQSRKFAHSPHFSLRFAPAAETRLAVSVSKKVAKSAVVRNGVRRRAYAALRGLIPSLPKGLYLLQAKSQAQTLKGEKLLGELTTLLKNL